MEQQLGLTVHGNHIQIVRVQRKTHTPTSFSWWSDFKHQQQQNYTNLKHDIYVSDLLQTYQFNRTACSIVNWFLHKICKFITCKEQTTRLLHSSHISTSHDYTILNQCSIITTQSKYKIASTFVVYLLLCYKPEINCILFYGPPCDTDLYILDNTNSKEII